MTVATRYIGTCPVCEGEFRLHRERMVHHGYRRPGHGSIEGDCPGVGYPPYEVSTEGTEHYLDRVSTSLLQTQDFLARLKLGEVDTIYVRDYSGNFERFPKMKPITAADGYDFHQGIRNKITETEHEVKGLQREVARCERLISNWHWRPIRTLEESIERESAAKAERTAVRAQERAVREAKKQATRDRVAAREQREAAFIQRWRTELLEAARVGDKHRGLGSWKRMHREAKKEVSSGNRFLMGFVKDMKIDGALFDMDLAKIEGDYLSYADETGWMIPVRRR